MTSANLYPFMGLFVTAVLTLWNQFGPLRLVGLLPRSLQWVPPIVLAILGAFGAAFESGAPWDVALAQGVAAGLVAIGAHHTLVKRVIQISGRGVS